MAPRLRPFVFWPHLVLGIVAGLVILVMSATGVVLTYQRQLIQWADRGYREAPAPGARALAIGELVTRAATAATSQVTVPRDGAAPIQINAGGRTLLVNRYTGAVLGESAPRLRAFFRGVTNWHRWLALEGASRQTARAITGAANVVFVLLALSGLYLWWPRSWNRAAVRNVTRFRRGLTPKARDFNWHNVFGFWMAIPIAAIAGSGVAISYPWASNLVYRLAGEAPPARSADRPAQAAAVDVDVDIDALLARAMAREPDWTTVSFRGTSVGGAPVVFTIDRGTGGQPQYKSTLTFDGQTGAENAYERFSDQSRGRRWRTWLRWIHTGEAGGFWGQTLAGVASFAGVVLVYSGLALSWRRFFRRSPSA